MPVSWIPPEQARELRVLLQLYRDLREEHTAWAQRIHAALFHQGMPGVAGRLADPQARAVLRHGQDIGLLAAGAQAVAAALRRMDDLDAALAPVHAQITGFARRQAGCKALAAELFGVGPLAAAIVWAFLGDTRRFSASAQAARHTGLDVTVYSSDDKRTPGHLSHQGPPILRWALEAAHQGSRAASPDHRYYTDVAARIDANRAALSIARKLARRSHHILRRLGDAAYAPAGLVRQMRVNAAALMQPMHRGHPPWPTPRSCPAATPRATAPDWTAPRDRRGHTAAGPPHRSSCRRDQPARSRAPR